MRIHIFFKSIKMQKSIQITNKLNQLKKFLLQIKKINAIDSELQIEIKEMIESSDKVGIVDNNVKTRKIKI